MKKKAFTLIELLVVIAIIIILAGIIFVSLNNANRKAKNAATISQASSIASGLQVSATGDTKYLDAAATTKGTWLKAVKSNTPGNTEMDLSNEDFGIDTLATDTEYYINVSADFQKIYVWAPLDGAKTYAADVKGVCYKNGNQQSTGTETQLTRSDCGAK